MNSTHKNQIRVNTLIHKYINEIQDRIDYFKSKRIDPSILDLIEEKKKSIDQDFYELGEKKSKQYLDNDQVGTHLRWEVVIKKTKELYPKLYVKQVDRNLLLNYKEYLEKLGNNHNTIHQNFKVIKAIYQEAVKLGITKENPFYDLGLKQTPSDKARLDLDEIKKIEALSYPIGSNLYLAQKTFLFAFYCWGMRFSDVVLLKWKNIDGDVS